MKACVNGKLVDESEAVVSVLDAGLLYGYGLFETMKAAGGAVFKLDRHLARLRSAAELIRLPVGWSDCEIKLMINDTLEANGLADAYVRLTLTRGASEPRLEFGKEVEPTIIVLVRKLPDGIREKQKKGVKLVVSKKHARSSTDVRCRIKTTNYLQNVLAKQEAAELGVDDVVLLNEKDLVAECSTANIFIVLDGKLVTPPVSAGALEGITRETVMELAQVEERDVSVDELFGAGEVFKTGSIMGIVPVVELNGKAVGDGKVGDVTGKIRAEYKKLTCG